MNLCSPRCFQTFAACCLAGALAASPAHGTVVSASEGFFWNEVYTRGKTQGPLHIWQRLPGTNTWIDTGIIVQSDASGNGYGSQWRPGSNSPFREDHDTVAGDITGPDLSQARFNNGVLLPPIHPTHVIRSKTTSLTIQVANVSTNIDGNGQGHTSAGYFAPGAMVALRLNTAQAQFTPGTITINGARITAVGPIDSLVDVTLDLQGAVSLYRDGIRVNQTTVAFGASSYIVQSLIIDAPPPPPANDTCAGAIPLALGVTATGDNTDATDDIGDSCASGGAVNSHKGVWYSFVPPATASYTVNTCGSTMPDTVLGVYTSSNCTTFSQIGCNDDSSSLSPANPCSNSTLNSRIPSISLTAGPLYYIHITSWGSAPAGGPYSVTVNNNSPLGSCCPSTLGTGTSCTMTDSPGCSGVFTAGGVCTPNPCVPQTGACCRGTTCAATIAAACPTQTGQRFAGLGTTCNVPGNHTTPCCAADFNQGGTVTVQDLFDFLAAYFSGDIRADINASSALTVQDLFDYLAAYFAGCT
jgi:hypothetical protein